MEIIVVDDNSDEWKEIYGLNELENKYSRYGLRYITYSGNHGACYARNVGLSKAEGEYVAFLDDDDEWLPDKIEKQISRMTDENIAMVYCSAKTIHETNGRVSDGQRCVFRGKIYPQLIIENFVGSTSFPLIRKSCLEEIGGFDVLMQSAQDYDVWLRLSEKYSIDYVDEDLGIYHVHSGEQITKNPDKKIAGLERLNEKNKYYLEQESNKNAKWIRTIKIAPFYAMKGQCKKAMDLWWDAVKINPISLTTNTKYLLYVFMEYRMYKKKVGGAVSHRIKPQTSLTMEGRCLYAF